MPEGKIVLDKPLFEIDITSRCNARCKFCYAKDKPTGPDMSISQFKHIINQLKKYEKQKKTHFRICIVGGEPFLNKNAAKMIKYAVSQFGNNKVYVTTNMYSFPKKPEEAARFIEKMGFPRLTVSIDAEHLQFGKNIPEKLEALIEAYKQKGISTREIDVISVKYNNDEKIPKKIQDLILKNGLHHEVRYYSEELKHEREMVKFFRRNANYFEGKTKHITQTPIDYFYSTERLYSGYSKGLLRKDGLTFAPDGKAYISNYISSLYVPQLSVGSWKKESLVDLVEKNAPYKAQQLVQWFDYRNNPKKTSLFGKRIAKRIEKLRQMRNAETERRKQQEKEGFKRKKLRKAK